jgi:hypothetical protein
MASIASLGFNDPRLGKSTFGKASSLNYRGGQQIVVTKEDTYAAAAASAAAGGANALRDRYGASPILAWGAEPMPTKAAPEVEITPAWVTLNQKVLKFYGFSDEPITDSNIETRRVSEHSLHCCCAALSERARPGRRALCRHRPSRTHTSLSVRLPTAQHHSGAVCMCAVWWRSW